MTAKKIFLLLLLLLGIALSAIFFVKNDSDIKYLFVGSIQSGPPITLIQSYAQNLNLPKTFITHKDCKSALNEINRSSNAVYLVFTEFRGNDSCLPDFDATDIIFTTNTSWYLCKAHGSTAELTNNRVTMGASIAVPISGFITDFNQRNQTSAVPVAVESSVQVVNSIINGDIKFGWVNPGMANPLVQKGVLECPYSFIKQDKNFIGKFFDFSVPDMTGSYVAIAKTKDDAVRQEIIRSARSEEFKKWLQEQYYFDTKFDGFGQQDIEWFIFNNRRLANLYHLENKR